MAVCNHDRWQVSCSKSQPIDDSPDSSAWGTPHLHGASRAILRASEAGNTECKEVVVVQTDHGGVQNGAVDVTVIVPASSKNATVQIFPRQVPVENTTSDLDLMQDTCGGSFFD